MYVYYLTVMEIAKYENVRKLCYAVDAPERMRDRQPRISREETEVMSSYTWSIILGFICKADRKIAKYKMYVLHVYVRILQVCVCICTYMFVFCAMQCLTACILDRG